MKHATNPWQCPAGVVVTVDTYHAGGKRSIRVVEAPCLLTENHDSDRHLSADSDGRLFWWSNTSPPQVELKVTEQ